MRENVKTLLSLRTSTPCTTSNAIHIFLSHSFPFFFHVITRLFVPAYGSSGLTRQQLQLVYKLSAASVALDTVDRR